MELKRNRNDISSFTIETLLTRVKRLCNFWKTCNCLVQTGGLFNKMTGIPTAAFLLIDHRSTSYPGCERTVMEDPLTDIEEQGLVMTALVLVPLVLLSLSMRLRLMHTLKLWREGLMLSFGFFRFFFFPEFFSLLGCVLSLFLDNGQSGQVSFGLVCLPLEMQLHVAFL